MRNNNRILQRMPTKYEAKIMEYHKFVISAREKKKCFELTQIGNMDKVPLTFNVPSNRSVAN
jgi:hypothetical protein